MSVSVCVRAVCLSVCLGQNVLRELVVTLHLRAGVKDVLVYPSCRQAPHHLPLLASLVSGSNHLLFFCFSLERRGEYSPCAALLETQPSMGPRLAPLLISENSSCPLEGKPPGVAQGKLF